MTTKAQKEKEASQASAFAAGFIPDFDRLDEMNEKPDIWVHRTGQQIIGLEVVEYHPLADGLTALRVEIESRWHSGIWPLIDERRRAKPSLQYVSAQVTFKDPKLPRKSEQQPLVDELLLLVERLALHSESNSRPMKAVFFPEPTTVAPETIHYNEWVTFLERMTYSKFRTF
jgi:hypothetical protein